MYRKKIEDVLSQCGTSMQGLSTVEAEARLKTNGPNKLQEAKKKTFFQKFLAQFKDILILILLVSCVVSAVLGFVNHSTEEFIDAGFILFVVIINAIIGIVQENKAETALENLRNMTKPYAKVLREGMQIPIRTEELVVGDIVVLEAGDIVPADVRLVDASSLKIEESALTGESTAVDKITDSIRQDNLPIGDQKNMAFMGSVVCYGRGIGVVVATGLDTQMGKISDMLGGASERTLLQKRIDKTSKILSVIVLVLSAVIFISELVYGLDWAHAFMVAISIAVCAIPEGLPTGVTITMAIGVQKMSKRKAIVKKLAAVETLGSTQVICTDKTGTLTLNQMTVVESYCGEEQHEYNRQELMRCMVLCNDTHAHMSDEQIVTMGDPTETALVNYAFTFDVSKIKLDKKYPRIGEIPFDSNRKLMTTVHSIDESVVVYTKGAVDQILEKCTHILDNGKSRTITEEDKERILGLNSSYAKKALRVLAYARRDLRKERENYNANEIEDNLCFIGLTGMIDPPREEVKDSVATCKKAGIDVVMITGDHKDTAFAIAKELGIAKFETQVITGKELNKMTDEELLEKVPNYRVFARVSPEHKVKIVKAWQAHEKVVAMTGDGVNDAPSIKCADIGVGMGITGTDVTKGVADIILTDDNFATIVTAVEEGRKIYNNVLKIIQFLLSTGVAEMLLLFVLIGIMGQTFFSPAVILWINFVSDTLPALALGVERAESDIMEKEPNPSKKNLFAGRVGLNILFYGIMQAGLIFGAYFIGKNVFGLSHDVVVTMCFVTLVVIELVHSYNLRSEEHSLFSTNPFGNKYVNWAFFASLLLTIVIVAIPMPPIQAALGIHTLSWAQWLVCLGVSLLIIPIAEAYKGITRLIRRNKDQQKQRRKQHDITTTK